MYCVTLASWRPHTPTAQNVTTKSSIRKDKDLLVNSSTYWRQSVLSLCSLWQPPSLNTTTNTGSNNNNKSKTIYIHRRHFDRWSWKIYIFHHENSCMCITLCPAKEQEGKKVFFEALPHVKLLFSWENFLQSNSKLEMLENKNNASLCHCNIFIFFPFILVHETVHEIRNVGVAGEILLHIFRIDFNKCCPVEALKISLYLPQSPLTGVLTAAPWAARASNIGHCKAKHWWNLQLAAST